MKTFKYIILSAVVALGMTSCSENEREYFDTQYSALNIWLGSQNIPTDSVIYNYSYAVGKDSVPFYARIAGTPADYDREFTLETVEGDTVVAACYTKKYVIPAGETSATFYIYFNSSNISDELFKTKDGHLVFRLKENNTFVAGAKEYQTLKFVLKNDLTKPSDWDVVTGTPASFYRTYAFYFGAYSKVKYQFMIATLGMMDFKIYYSSAPYDREANTISWDYATLLKQRLQVALDEYNATHDTPLTDEFGELVTF